MLALIAGTGDLPPALIARLPERPLVCALQGFTSSVTPDITFRLETLGTFLEDLRERGVTEVCMAGAVRRPKVDSSLIDAATSPLVPRISEALAKGDDGALRVIIALFEEAGIIVKAAHEIAPDLLPEVGVPTVAQPGTAHRQDAVTAEQVIAEMGAADQGQACVVRRGQVLAREGRDGTDAMLARFQPDEDPLWGAVDMVGDMLGSTAEWLSGPDAVPSGGRGAILFKAPKPHQDRRADLPVIGPATAKAVFGAGFAGIVVEAGGVMVLDQPAIIRTLNAADAFLWVRPKGGA
ncbi:MAG: UDP-2,3-diacylglucosamine diphosphatase LpxI [Pseudomonadota bacterium]